MLKIFFEKMLQKNLTFSQEKNPIKNKLTNDKEYALIISENLIFQVKLLKRR